MTEKPQLNVYLCTVFFYMVLPKENCTHLLDLVFKLAFQGLFMAGIDSAAVLLRTETSIIHNHLFLPKPVG